MASGRKPAPEIPGNLGWINTATAIPLHQLRGTLVLLAFIDGSSVESVMLLGELARVAQRHADYLRLMFVHSPAFPAARRRSHAEKLASRHWLRFPVIHDSTLVLRTLYGIQRLPSLVLIDTDGYIVGTMPGSANLSGLDAVIRHQAGRTGGRQYRKTCPEPVLALPKPSRVLQFPGRISAWGERICVSDSGHHRILIMSGQGGVIRQYGGTSSGFVDAIGAAAAFNRPQGLVVSDDFLFVADSGNHAIRRINLLTDEVVTVAGNGAAAKPLHPQKRYPAGSAMHTPMDLTSGDGMLYIAMAGVNQIWQLSLLSNTVELLSGSGQAGMQDGAGMQASFNQPSGLALAGKTLYCTDAFSGAVRSLDVFTGYVTTLVNGRSPGPGEKFRPVAGAGYALQFPQAVAASPDQQMLWIADSYNDRICRIDIGSPRSGILVQVSGLDEPAGLAFLGDTLYIANTNAHEILRMIPGASSPETLDVNEEYTEIRS